MSHVPQPNPSLTVRILRFAMPTETHTKKIRQTFNIGLYAARDIYVDC